MLRVQRRWHSRPIRLRFLHGRLLSLAVSVVRAGQGITKVGGQLVFQTMLRGSDTAQKSKDDYHFWDTKVFASLTSPACTSSRTSMRATRLIGGSRISSAAEAMLRSAGLKIVANPEVETWICEPQFAKTNGHYILDAGTRRNSLTGARKGSGNGRSGNAMERAEQSFALGLQDRS